MASNSWLPVEDLTCPVCQDIFKNPVLLQCSHSACKDCLREYWHHKGFQECPVCRKRSLSCPPPVNLALKNLCEAYLQGRHGAETDPAEQNPVLQDPEEKRQAALTTLHGLLKVYEEVRDTLTATASLIRIQDATTEREIRKGFNQLQHFLQTEEKARIDVLTREKEHKTRMVVERTEKLCQEMSSCSDSIKDIEALAVEDASFLQNLKAIMERVPCTLPDPHSEPGELINVAEHLGNLQFNVWEKMQGIVNYSPVVLDPNTADDHFRLSEELTKLTNFRRQAAPAHPGRFDNLWIRGSAALDSGTHSWDVAVDNSESWCVGVVFQSVVDNWTDPSPSVWGVNYEIVDYDLDTDKAEFRFSAVSPYGSVPVSEDTVPQKIRVHLNCEREELAFSDPDNNTKLHTFTLRLTEGGVFPVFMAMSDLKILQFKTTVAKS